MKPIKVLLLTDFPPKGFTILDLLRRFGLECDAIGTRYTFFTKQTPRMKYFYRWFPCLWVSIKAFSIKRNYDYVIAWQQVMGIIFGLFKVFCRFKKPRLMLLNATILPRSNIIKSFIRKGVVRIAFRGADNIQFLSNTDKELQTNEYSLPINKSFYMPYCINIENRDEVGPVKLNGYIYSVGISYRDYETLMLVAKQFPKEFVVATQPYCVRGIAIPENVTVHFNTFHEGARQLMREASAVVLPLSNAPSGEMTLLEAMWYKKPVIITRTITTPEYIDDKVNGLLVDYRNADDIINSLNYIFADESRAQEMGKRAHEKVKQNFTNEQLVRKIVEIIHADYEKYSTRAE